MKIFKFIRSNLALVVFAGLVMYFMPYIQARFNTFTGTANHIYQTNTQDMSIYNNLKQYQPVSIDDLNYGDL